MKVFIKHKTNNKAPVLRVRATTESEPLLFASQIMKMSKETGCRIYTYDMRRWSLLFSENE